MSIPNKEQIKIGHLSWSVTYRLSHLSCARGRLFDCVTFGKSGGWWPISSQFHFAPKRTMLPPIREELVDRKVGVIARSCSCSQCCKARKVLDRFPPSQVQVGWGLWLERHKYFSGYEDWDMQIRLHDDVRKWATWHITPLWLVAGNKFGCKIISCMEVMVTLMHGD